MSPWQEFRFWLRRGTREERVAAALAAVIAVGLLVWLLTPADQSRDATATSAPVAGAPAEGAASTPSTVAAAATVTGSGAPVQGSASAPSATGSGVTEATAAGASCAFPGATTTGVTPSEIKISITLVEIVGPTANRAFGLPTTDEQRADYEAVIDAINRDGGIACRKVTAQFFTINPADQADMQAKCLQAADAGVFAHIDAGGYAQFSQKHCYPQHQIPFFGGYYTSKAELEQFFPYMFDMNSLDVLYRNTVFSLRDRGFFSKENGFQKLGFVYRSCLSSLMTDEKEWLQEAGVPPSSLVTFDVGCPSALANPSDLFQAVLTFKRAGVTHVTTGNFVGDFANFTNIAEQQGFRPKYGLPDDALVTTTYGASPPNGQNIAGAVAISSSRSGEDRTPGMVPTPGTIKCDAIYRAHGRPPVYRRFDTAGNACNGLWMLKAAVEHAPALRREALAEGLRRAGTIDFAFPSGPNDFTGSHVTTGGEFWRVVEYHTDCSCWQVIDRDFHPSFK